LEGLGFKYSQSNVSEHSSTQHLKPIFVFEKVVSGFSEDNCNDKQKKSALIDKIMKWSKMTWADIMQSPKEQFGCEIIEKLKVPKPSFITEDIRILAFRFLGTDCRLIGYRDGQYFYVVWVDWTLQVYDH
jgi:hypothetical protein